MTNQQDTALLPVAAAICAEENGPDYECKTCRNSRYRRNPETNEDEYVDLPEGCLGKGYERHARAALAAHRLQAPAEAGEEVERVIRRTIPRVHLMISDGHYDGAAKILATALHANASGAQANEAALKAAFLDGFWTGPDGPQHIDPDGPEHAWRESQTYAALASGAGDDLGASGGKG
jgi:hypothetical protein